jgi:glycosyltransferase involved in cell wall biosynthesis
MLNALYPGPESAAEYRALSRTIAELGLDAHVTLMTDFLDERTVLGQLAAADLIIYPYQHTQESGSGAIKLGLASLTPVVCTPLPIFDDGNDVVHRLPGITPSEIASGLDGLLADRPKLAGHRIRQKEWVEAHEWTNLSRRLDGLLRGEAVDLLTPRWRLSPPKVGAEAPRVPDLRPDNSK